MSRTVVVLTQEMDLTADSVIKVLNDRDVPVFRYDTSYFPVTSSLTYKSERGGWTTVLRDRTYGQRELDLESIASIWYRRPTAFRFHEQVNGPFREFAQRESAHAVGGILTSLPILWVNRPDAESRADYKPFQLRLAKAAGLRIPDTLITNDPDEVKQFWSAYSGQIIYKALNSGLIREPGGWPGGLFTSPVAGLDEAMLSRVTFAPCIFQERIAKAYDLRVTIIGDRLYPVRIDGNDESGERALDWRACPVEVEDSVVYSQTTIPAHIEDGLQRVMKGLGIAYGAADLVVTPEGEHVFLEVNASGQFAWLDDEIPELNLRGAMATYLAMGLSDELDRR